MTSRVWLTDAACLTADPEIFYTGPGDGGRQGPYEDARRICTPCPVREQCLDYAMAREGGPVRGQPPRWGMWGGMTPDERHLLAMTMKETP